MGRAPDHVFRLEGKPTAGAGEPFGDSLAVSFADGTIRVYGPSGDVRKAWKAGERGFGALAFSGDGLRLAGGGRDGRVTVLDSKEGREVGSFPAHATRIETLALSRDGGIAATASGSEASAFRAADGTRLFTIKSPFAEVASVSIAPSGGRAAVGFTDVDVRLVDLKTGRVTATISDLEMAAFCLAFSPDDRHLVCGCADGRVSIRDAVSGARVCADARHGEPVGAVAFAPHGSWVTSVGYSMNPATREASVRATSVSADISATEALGVLTHVTLGFSADGIAHVASPGPEGVRVWNVAPPTSRS